MTEGVPMTRFCACSHDAGCHDLANRCLVQGCGCDHFITTPDREYPPCRYCANPSTFLLIAYREPGWPTTPLCNNCLCNFVRRALAFVPASETTP